MAFLMHLFPAQHLVGRIQSDDPGIRILPGEWRLCMSRAAAEVEYPSGSEIEQGQPLDEIGLDPVLQGGRRVIGRGRRPEPPLDCPRIQLKVMRAHRRTPLPRA